MESLVRGYSESFVDHGLEEAPISSKSLLLIRANRMRRILSPDPRSGPCPGSAGRKRWARRRLRGGAGRRDVPSRRRNVGDLGISATLYFPLSAARNRLQIRSLTTSSSQRCDAKS